MESDLKAMSLRDPMTPTIGGRPTSASAKQALGWVVTPPFLLAFGLVLAVFDSLQRLARLFGRRPHEWVVALLQCSLKNSLRLCGTRFSVERDPGVRPGTPYVLIANHQSMFDVPIVASYLVSNFPKFVAKRELARWIPSISFNLRHGGNALIDRGNRTQAVATISELGRSAQARSVSVVIYPEGTRARHGVLGQFKPAGTLALLESAPDLAVVPVAIDGSWELLRYRMRPVPFGTRVRVRLGAPIARRPDEDAEELVGRCEREIRQTLDRWRGARARESQPQILRATSRTPPPSRAGTFAISTDDLARR
jgi:1-acyl-sn-glycerol-3-phosphate acyltransferase